jgi:lipoprotein-anchoring transpeptidase ErfK/SrfK
MRARDLGVAVATGIVVGTCNAGAETYQRSPPWNAQARASTFQLLSPLAAPGLHSTAPSASPGGPTSPTPSVRADRPASAPAQPDQRSPTPRRSTINIATDRATATVRRVVPFAAQFPAGSLVIVNRERALYHVGADGTATRYPVAIGSFTEEWTGVEFITDKKVNPTWFPVQEPGAAPREPVPGGDPSNPLGVRALYLGRTLWRIHGTPAAESIGQAVSAGCIRMLNEHVVDLYDKVMLGTEVYVVDRLTDPLPLHRGRKVME